MSEATESAKEEGSREGLVLTERILGHVIGLLVLVQAALAGHSEWIAGTIDIEIHGVVGNATFTLILVAVVLAVVTQVGALRLGVLGALALLAVAQIGLGYMGRSSSAAAAWHVPLGVAIFGIAVYNIVLAREARMAARADS
ncbi:MAG: hypothetical protein KY395_03500 [Actinobacteria bacterium]|nr:hypothetical protein [Actinomycetota bacterium]